jgi:cation transport regulator ChaB
MNLDIAHYNNKQTSTDKEISDLLASTIDAELDNAESKIWHAHPVWFLDGNPIAGYGKQEKGIRLMFWSDVDFDEEKPNVKGAKFKDASIFYNEASEINIEDVKRWLQKSKTIHYKKKGKIRKNIMIVIPEHNEKIAKMTFSSVYPHYVTKVKKKKNAGRIAPSNYMANRI